MVGLHYLRQLCAGQQVLPNLQRNFHEVAFNSRPNFQIVELLLLQFGERAHLVHFRLLLRKLRLNRFLRDIQAFVLNIVPGREIIELALRVFVLHPGNHAEVIKGLVEGPCRCRPGAWLG